MPKSCPHPQPLSQAWERGARAFGSGGVRANHTLNQQRRALNVQRLIHNWVRPHWASLDRECWEHLQLAQYPDRAQLYLRFAVEPPGLPVTMMKI